MTEHEHSSRITALEVLTRDLRADIAALQRDRRPTGARDLTSVQRLIVNAVSESTNVPIAHIFNPGRGPAPVSEARMALYWHLHDDGTVVAGSPGMSYSQIGRLIGRRPDTIASGVRRIDNDDRLDGTHDKTVAAVRVALGAPERFGDGGGVSPFVD